MTGELLKEMRKVMIADDQITSVFGTADDYLGTRIYVDHVPDIPEPTDEDDGVKYPLALLRSVATGAEWAKNSSNHRRGLLRSQRTLVQCDVWADDQIDRSTAVRAIECTILRSEGDWNDISVGFLTSNEVRTLYDTDNRKFRSIIEIEVGYNG